MLVIFEPSPAVTSLEEGLEMVKHVAESGADGIKFQVFLTGEADRFISDRTIEVEYEVDGEVKTELMYEVTKRKELSKEEWHKIFYEAGRRGLEIIVSAYFPDTVEWLAGLKRVSWFKIGRAHV